MELRGPNGSGKSSLLRLVAGLNEPTAGSISLSGIGDHSIAESCHYIGHAEAIKSALTVSQNLSFWAKFLNDDRVPPTTVIPAQAGIPLGNDRGGHERGHEAFSLSALRNDPARLLSSGQKHRLSLAKLVAVERPLWLLDEPTVGLDAASTEQLNAVLKNHLSKGGMAIIATHQALGVTAHQQLNLEARS